MINTCFAKISVGRVQNYWKLNVQTSLYKIDISGWSTSHMERFANAVRQSLIINPLLVKHCFGVRVHCNGWSRQSTKNALNL